MPSPPLESGAETSASHPAPGSPGKPDREGRLTRLIDALDELGADVRRGGPIRAAVAPRPTGLAEIDRLLGGGLPRGRLCEIAGPASSGRTSLALALLARTTHEGHWVAWIDAADALDPASAEASGVRLEHVLWARPRDPEAALRSAERVLGAGGFGLVGIDLAHTAARQAPPAAAFARLRRLAAGTDAVLLVLGSERLTGATADLAVALESPRARFADAPVWLEGLETHARLVRNRSGPSQLVASLHLRAAAA